MALATNLEQDFTNVASPLEGIDPQHILDLIHKIPVAECISGKTFWSTDKKWDILGDLQQQKQLFFGKLIFQMKLKIRYLPKLVALAH